MVVAASRACRAGRVGRRPSRCPAFVRPASSRRTRRRRGADGRSETALVAASPSPLSLCGSPPQRRHAAARFSYDAEYVAPESFFFPRSQASSKHHGHQWCVIRNMNYSEEGNGTRQIFGGLDRNADRRATRQFCSLGAGYSLFDATESTPCFTFKEDRLQGTRFPFTQRPKHRPDGQPFQQLCLSSTNKTRLNRHPSRI